MNKLHRFLALAAFLLVAAATPSWGEIVDRVIAVVNDDVITQYELESTVELVLNRYGQSIPPGDRERIAGEARKVLLDRMIDDLLLRQEAKRLGITVRDEDITKAIQENLQRRKMSLEDLQQALVKEGSSYEKYREATRSDLIKMRIMQREIRPRISVTNEEIGLFYQEHRDEYEGKLMVRLQMIFLPVPDGGDPAVKEQQRVKAQDHPEAHPGRRALRGPGQRVHPRLRAHRGRHRICREGKPEPRDRGGCLRPQTGRDE